MSGRKNQLSSFKNYDAVSMGASATSTVTCIQFLDNIGVQLDWTGSPSGNFQVQVSANYSQDELGNVISAGTWVPLVLSYWDGSQFVTSTNIPTTLGSPVYLDLALLSAPYIRVVYTRSGGTGTLNGRITAKMV